VTPGTFIERTCSGLPAAPAKRKASRREGERGMKAIYMSMMAVAAMAVSGCAGTTPINSLVLPPVTTIEGTVTQAGESGFTLSDETGSILVRAKLPDDRKLDLSPEEKVKVYGNLQGGQERIFDAYVIRKPSGEKIVVNNPTPHFGFVIQSSFQ
jgi:hypothetical protein